MWSARTMQKPREELSFSRTIGICCQSACLMIPADQLQLSAGSVTYDSKP